MKKHRKPKPVADTYTIKAGDTLYRIAQRLGTTVSAIEALNPGIHPNTLAVGRVINVPASGSVPVPAPAPAPAPAPVPAPGPAPAPSPTGSFLFADEFDGPAGSSPNSKLWTLESGAQSGENPGAVGNYSPANCFLDGNSNLVIRAPSKSASGRMTTKGKFEHQYGTYEARIKFAHNAGCWPAWWMIGDTYPDMGEIDMWEVYGNAWAPGTCVYDNAGNDHKECYIPAMADGAWHVWRMDWVKGGMTFYQDGKQYFAVKAGDVQPWPYDGNNPMYMIVNQTLGGTGGGSSFGSFPHDLLVDYIRVSA